MSSKSEAEWCRGEGMCPELDLMQTSGWYHAFIWEIFLSETRTCKGMWWWVGGYGSLERQYYWAIINLWTGKHVEGGDHLSELLIMSQPERFPHLPIDTRIAKIWDWSLSYTIQEKTWNNTFWDGICVRLGSHRSVDDTGTKSFSQRFEQVSNKEI